MSKVEEGNLFFRRFGRTALALSMVTTSFILADQTIAVDASQLEYLENGETNTSSAAGVEADGSGANVTVNNGVDVSGAIIAGENRGSGLPIPQGQTDTFTYHSANDSTGIATGLEINATILDLVNLGTIGATADTLASYTDTLGQVHYPDQNNTTLAAVGVNVANAITSINNSGGDITASAVLNNDTNNSTATATGILVSVAIGEGILNTGDITAIASTHDLVSDGNGGVTNRLVATIGGRQGNGGQEISTADLGDKANYAAVLLDDNDAKVGSDSTMVMANNNLSHTAQTNPRLVSDTRRYDDKLLDRNNADNYASQSLDTDNRADYNDQFHIVDADGAHQKDRMQEQNFIRTDNGGDNNSHMHRGTYTAADLGSPGDLDNVIAAAGIKVDAAVTGGIINHSYISSVLTEAALTGSADGNEVGLTVTPNTGALAGADTTGIDPNAVVTPTPATPTADPVPNVTGGGAVGSQGGVIYAPPAVNNGLLDKDNPYKDDTLQAILDAKALEEAALPAEPTQAQIDAVKLSEADLAAISADLDKAYGKAPDVDAAIAAQVAAKTPAAPATAPIAGAPALPTDGFKAGTHTARIGNTVLNAATAGSAAQGILVRASSSTNLNDEINATTGKLTASDGLTTNPDRNANVTSGTVSAYLGEGVDVNGDSRVITRDDNRLTNGLIGGLENNAAVTGALGASGMTLTSDAQAVADRADGINVNQYSESDGNGGTTVYDIKSNPTSIVGVGTLMNTAGITGGLGGSGLEVLATSVGGVSAADSNISGQELIVSPTAITNVRELINMGDIAGGLGGNAINGKALAIGSITATDINLTAGGVAQTEGISVVTHADATIGNIFSSGNIKQALGEDALKLEADGSATLAANSITDSIVNLDTTSIGGVRKVFGKDGNATKLTEGNLLNAGEISVALSAHAVNMHAEGLAVLADKDKAPGTTAVLNSDINISNETITGVEGNFVNVAWAGITDDDTLEKGPVKRGVIKAALAADAIHLDANGVAKLEALSLENSNVNIVNRSTSGVGETFANYGEVSVALSANAVNFASVSTTTLGKADETTIIAGTTTVSNYSTSGVRGDFINGASAIETGTLNEANTTVHNPEEDLTNDNVDNPTLIKAREGYYEVAANINDTNSSDTNSTDAHPNDVLAGGQSTDGSLNQLTQVVVHSYNKEAAITSGAIKAALATDAVKFDSVATGDLKVVSIGASTASRIDTDDGDAEHNVFDTRATVTSISVSDSSVGGNFINNGEISVALAAEGVNGVSTATGTLGSSGDNNVVVASTVTQYTASRAGVQGDFINEDVSREVGAATVFTAQSGAEEVGAFTYARSTNIGDAKITASLAKNAVTLESHATNLIDLKETNAAAFVADNIGSGVSNGTQSRNLATWKDIAGATRSDINSTTTSIAGVGGNFSNTGTISVSLAAIGFDALADGTNTLGTTTATQIKGTNVVSNMSSVAGVQGNFTNDIQSLKDGAATLVYRDVYNIDENNAQVSPKYYDNEDALEGERVKSNVVDRVVYNRALAQGQITAALAADAINLNATGTTSILADRIGTSAVEVVTNHTGYDVALENNATKVEIVGISDLDRTIKVTSEDVRVTSTVVAGIGGQFTNRNIISTSLAKNALTAMGTATTTLGMTAVTEIEGGNVLAATLVMAGIGNDLNTTNNEGFLNAAGTYDVGTVQVGTSKVIAGENNTDHLILAVNSNSAIDANKTNLDLIDSHDVVFWNRQAPIVGEMSAALSADVVKVDGLNAGSVIPKLITAAMGDVNVTTLGADGTMVSVVGEHVEGTARANVSSTSIVIAGINGGLTNQGKLTAALAGNVIMAQADGKGIIGDATASIKGSTVTQTTTTIAGIQDGDFVNETLSFETDNGEVVTVLNGNVETPTVVFDRATTDGSVEMSAALSGTVAQLEALADNKVEALLIEASSGVKYAGAATTWEIDTILSSARPVSSDVNSTTSSTAGVSGNFYNSGKITVALSKDAIDGIADAKNAIGTRQDEEIKGSNVTASSTAIAGIRGDFTNDVVTLDNGAKHIVDRDVVDANGNPVYQLSGDTAPGDRIKSNVVLTNSDDQHHENATTGHGVAQLNNSGDGVATDGAVYAQLVVEGEIGAALSGDAIKLDATGTNDVKPLAIKEAEVSVVRMDVQTGTLSNNEIHATASDVLVVDVTSDTTANTTVVAGIGGRFTNRSSKEIKVSLSKNAITAISTATTTWGDAAKTVVQGGTHIANTYVVAGIGNGESENDGFANLADSYNTGIHTDVTTQVASNNVAGHALNDANANAAIATDANNSLPLIDSAEVVYWDNTVVVGKISAALSKDTLNLEAFSTGNLTPNKALAVVNDVNVSDALQAVAGYHVTGSSVGANITQTTTSIAGINGGFLNEGEISTSLSGNVVNTRGTATGTVGDVGNTVVVGSTLDGTTRVLAGIQGGDFNNTVKSLDTVATAATVVTVLDATGVETPKVVFTRATTDGKVKLEASLSKDVVLLDVTAKNLVDAKSIDASEYVLSTAGATTLDAAKSGMSNVTGRSIALGGLEGNFYNTGIIEAKLSLNAITTHATADNDLGSGVLKVKGSNVTATSLAYARIGGDFINDARLFDTGAPKINFDVTAEGNTSNVAGSVTYDQQLVKGLIKSGLSKDVLSLVATGTNTINLAEVKNTAVKVVSISANDLNADANHSVSDNQIISSNIKASSTAHSGIGGVFINAGTMETATGKDVINMQAVGGPATITVLALGGGTVEGNNTVLSGINLAATSTLKFGDIIADKKYTTILPAGIDLSAKADDVVGFLNDKRDFNTLLESDTTSETAHTTTITGHKDTLVATGEIKANLAQVTVNMVATGGVTTTITADAGKIYTTDVDANSPYGTATVSNVGNNNVVIQGDFVNLGDIKTGTAGNVLNMVATNEATTDLGTLTADTAANTGGLVQSTAISNVGSYIAGDIINTGEMSSGTAGNVINMEAIGGISKITLTMADHNLTDWAANNGKVVASNEVNTQSSANNIINSGLIKSGAAGVGIKLNAEGAADSSAFVNNATNTALAGNAIVVNRVDSNVSIQNLTNIGTIHSVGANAIEIHATGSAKRAFNLADVNASSYEDTSARVNASVADISNTAFTRQNALWEVNSIFNTDDNATTDDQLRPTEDIVVENLGEYDLTSGAKIDSNESTYSTAAELDRLAYGAGVETNTSAPILSQTIGLIKSDAANAIDIVALATESNSTLVTASTGHILNSGLIDASAAGIGINISASGVADPADELNKGAKAVATVGVIANFVVDNTFKIGDLATLGALGTSAKPQKDDVVHAILEGKILGLTAGIKIDAGDASKKDVSVATVDQIVNYRRVLNEGDYVISSAGADKTDTTNADDPVNETTADGKVTNNGSDFGTVNATRETQNYGITQLTVDGVYNAVIGDETLAGSSIIVGENAHVTDGILNYGELAGKVELGDADLQLYGLVQNKDHNITFGARPETDEMGLTDNYFAVTDGKTAYIDAETHVQVAGIISTTADTDPKVINAVVGSNIFFNNSHILKGGTYEADHITVSASSIVNIDDDTTFVTETAPTTSTSTIGSATLVSNPFDVNLSDGVHNMFTNSGYLNVRAGKKATVTGNYEQKGGFFVTNVKTASILAGSQVNLFDTHDFGQLDVSGNADLSGGILVMMDDVGADGESGINLDDTTQAAGAETRLVDVVKAATLSVDGTDLTHAVHTGAADSTAANLLTGVKVQDNSRLYDYEVVNGTTAGGVSLRIAPQDPNAAPITIDTTNVAISAIKTTTRIIADRIDSGVPTFNFGGTPTRPTVNFTATATSPVVTPNAQGTVGLPATGQGQTGGGTDGGTGTVNQSDLDSRVAVLSQATDAAILGDVVLGTGAQIQPSLGDYEIAKVSDLNQTKQLNMWGKIYYSHAEQDGDVASKTTIDANNNVKAGQAGYTSNSYGLIAGADKKHGEWFVGTAVALGKSHASTSSGASTSSETTMFQVTEYASRPTGDGRVNMQGSFAYLTNDKDRTDGVLGDGQGSDGKNYNSNYDGYALNAAVEYEQGFTVNKNTMLIPYVGLSALHVSNDGYTEKGGNNAQEVSGASSSALIAGVGTRAQFRVSENSAIVANVGVGYDMIAESVEYEARTALNSNSQTLHIEGAEPEALEYEVGLGYQFVTPGNTIIRANADYRARDGYKETTGSLKVYYPF